MEDVENINIWPGEIELWQCIAKLSIKQLGASIYLSLPSKIHQAYIDISVPFLSSDNSLGILLEKIKGLYCKVNICWCIWHMIHSKHSIIQVALCY